MPTNQFQIQPYGEAKLIVDWNGLADPFTQYLPVQIANNYSGTLWFQGQLSSPPTRYSNYSGINMSSIATQTTAVLTMSWDTGVSGYVASSSPVTDNLTYRVIAFTSSNYTGEYGRASLAVTNFTYNRMSGMIKLFGDNYINDVPAPVLERSSGGTLISGQTYAYGLSYISSGFEFDIGGLTSIQNIISGGAINLTWGVITSGQQWNIWRYSGPSSDNPHLFSSNSQSGMVFFFDLVGVVTTGAFTDSGGTLGSGFVRHTGWQDTATSLTMPLELTTFVSPPSSRRGANLNTWTHAFQINKNTSGTSLLGPFYIGFKGNYSTISGTRLSFGYVPSPSTLSHVVGTLSVMASRANSQWWQETLMPISQTKSGYFYMQIDFRPSAGTVYIDDCYVVANS